MIINTVVSGGQGGGDKVTALVGSNASGIDVGDKVILNYPAGQDITYTTTTAIDCPVYFDGQILVSTGGRFSANADGTLTYLGGSGIGVWSGANMSTFFATPPNYLLDGTIFYCVYPDNGVLYIKDGSVSGSLPYNSSESATVCDSNLDSTKTGYMSTSAGVISSGYGTIYYFLNGSKVATLGSRTGAIYADNGNVYSIAWDSSNCHRVSLLSVSGSSIIESQIFTTTTLFTMNAQRGTYLACCTSKEDNYSFWYRRDQQPIGFTQLNLTNSTLDAVSPPTALNIIKGTVWQAWWDNQNRLYLRTTKGIYVFSYSNHEISTMTLLKRFEWDDSYNGPACISPSLRDYAVGNYTDSKAYTEGAIMPVYEFSANVYNGLNFDSNALTGFVNEAPYIDENNNLVVDVNTVLPPA